MTTNSRFPGTLADPASLVRHLGGEAFAVPIPSNDGAERQQLGLLGGLPIWWTTGAPADVRFTARRLARRGVLGVIFGHDTMAGRWFAAATIPPVRLAVMGAGDWDALPLRRLARAARTARPTPLEQAIAFADAIDVDAAGRQTFRLLHQLLDRAVSLLPGNIARDDRHAWALTQITRLLFLRFVEAEGWLAGNPRFLAEAFDRCLIAGRDPARHLLHPLFFGTLNRRCDDRSRFARAFGTIPFLNGGLFEPQAIERMHRLSLPTSFWSEVFAALVDRVDVTLDPGTEDGRVTPELLGRVFEGVMSSAERKQDGTFFTPPALVSAILRQALACHLAPKLRQSEDRVEQSLDDPDARLRRLLLDVTVLDPAVGSGAFLVGALGLLHGPGPREPSRVRHLVTRRLFGVDRHPGAVRLCELRLWLEVLRAMRGRPPARVPPLPNLDAQIRAGDALIDPLGRLSLDHDVARRIRRRQHAILGAHGTAKRVAISDARRTERTAMLQAIRDQEGAIDREIAELLEVARAPTLFGDRPRTSPALRRDVERRRRERAHLRAERRRLLRDSVAAPFAIGAAFAPAIAGRGGFALVVGNPPWVRAERLPRATRDALAERYRWWRCDTGAAWRHQPDLAVAFMERGFELLAAGGTMALLVPAKVATAGYGSVCRAGLTLRAAIHRVANLDRDPIAGFDATTYPLAIIASRRPPAEGHLVRLGLRSDDPAQPQALWQASTAWATASPETQRIAMRLAREHPRLAELVKPQLGVKTGANAAFLDPPDELLPWSKPAIRGRDIRPFVARAGVRLLWPADERGVAWAILPPALAAYLSAHVTRLERRADQHAGPWWQLFRTRAATAAHRVVWRDLAPDLQAAVPEDAAVPLNSCYVAAVSSAIAAESLAAWLNATPIRVLARVGAEPAAGGCARFAARTIGNLPLPREALGSPVLASFAHAGRDRDIQSALDDCVSDLLDLSPTERNTIVAVAKNRR